MARTDGNIIIGTSVDVGGINTGLSKIQRSFKRLGNVASLALGIGAFVKLGKAALDAASDLQEVQNIVDVTFKTIDENGNVIVDMTGKIEQFAETCIEKFGMSEYAAKQTAGSFMAMGKSMGLSMEEASNMSVKLTGLTGDFASFYNISQDYARVALSAVYTGETETLKRYGIVLTEANLQEYATAQGIETTVKKMGAREKAILRYNYILKATTDMEGDFVRTQGSWANSTRVLSQVWNQFLIVLGSGLISVLSPLVQVLNQIIQRLTVFTQQLWQILSNIFGFQLQDITKQAGGAASSVGDLADATEDLGNEVEKAGKKAKKQLATFDELNNLTTTDSSSSSGAGGAGGIEPITFDTSALTDPTKKDSPWADIDNLYDLGKWIGQKLCDMMENINWEEIYEKARNFGKGLAQFLNGLISTDLFKDLGHTIAGALNTAIYAALEFATEFDWVQLGEKLAAGVNEFFATFDFASLAQAINKWVQGLFTTLKEFIKNVDWKQVFSGIKEFFSNLDPETVAIIFGFIILKKLIKMGLMSALIGGIKEGLGIKTLPQLFAGLGTSIATALKWVFSGTSLPIMVSNIANGLKTAFQMAFITVQGFFTQTLPALGSSLAAGFQTLFYNLGLGNSLNASMTYAFGGIATTIAGFTSILAGGVLGIVNFVDAWKNGVTPIKVAISAISGFLIALGLVILGVVGWPALIVGAVVGAAVMLIVVIKNHWKEICDWASGIVDWVVANVIDPVVDWVTNMWDTITTGVKNFIEPIANFFKGLFKRIGQFAEGCWIIVKAIWMVVSEWFNTNVIQPVSNFFKKLWNDVKGFFQKLWNDVKTIWNIVATWFNNNVIQPLINFFSPIVAKIAGFFSQLWSDIKSVWDAVATWFSTNVIDPVVDAWNTAIESIKGFFSSLWESIESGVVSAMNVVLDGIESAINWIIDKINGVLEGFNAVGKWAAKKTGDSWDGIDLVPNVSIPRLATGGVIPPNSPFMAMLGDNKKETEIVSPLSTMKQALLEALKESNIGGGNNNDIVVQIDGREVFRAVQKQNNNYINRTGSSAFVY